MFFDSNLFHRSVTHKFKKGYKHMRINLTLLFGLRRAAFDPQQQCLSET